MGLVRSHDCDGQLYLSFSVNRGRSNHCGDFTIAACRGKQVGSTAAAVIGRLHFDHHDCFLYKIFHHKRRRTRHRIAPAPRVGPGPHRRHRAGRLRGARAASAAGRWGADLAAPRADNFDPLPLPQPASELACRGAARASLRTPKRVATRRAPQRVAAPTRTGSAARGAQMRREGSVPT